MLLIAVEKVPDAMVVAMERVRDAGLTNVFFIDADAALLPELFAPGEVDRIYIIIIDRGELVFNGTPQQLKEKAPHGDRVLVTLLQVAADDVRAALEKLPQVRLVETVKQENNKLTLAIHPSGRADDFALTVKRLLDERKWEFCELHTQSGKLDEVFRCLTTSDSTGRKEGAA